MKTFIHDCEKLDFLSKLLDNQKSKRFRSDSYGFETDDEHDINHSGSDKDIEAFDSHLFRSDSESETDALINRNRATLPRQRNVRRNREQLLVNTVTISDSKCFKVFQSNQVLKYPLCFRCEYSA